MASALAFARAENRTMADSLEAASKGLVLLAIETLKSMSHDTMMWMIPKLELNLINPYYHRYCSRIRQPPVKRRRFTQNKHFEYCRYHFSQKETKSMHTNRLHRYLCETAASADEGTVTVINVAGKGASGPTATFLAVAPSARTGTGFDSTTTSSDR